MCGIAGATRRNRTADRSTLDVMLRQLDHRAPDSWGGFVVAAGAIGQNRLRTIDLVTGDPPIATPDGRVGVVSNGEIYNYRGPRGELEARGHRFATNGDTEVIVHL